MRVARRAMLSQQVVVPPSVGGDGDHVGGHDGDGVAEGARESGTAMADGAAEKLAGLGLPPERIRLERWW